MQTIAELQGILEGKQFMRDYHTAVIPLLPTEFPNDEQLAQLCVDIWYDVPGLADRIKSAQAQIDEIDGQRVLIIWFRRWPSDPKAEELDYDA